MVGADVVVSKPEVVVDGCANVVGGLLVAVKASLRKIVVEAAVEVVEAVVVVVLDVYDVAATAAVSPGDEAVAIEATATTIPTKTGAKNGATMPCLSLSIGILESIRFKRLGRRSMTCTAVA